MAKEGGCVSERTTREWALAYAGLGWRVFPVASGGKKPMYKGWQRDATTDPGLIARYWRSGPGPNIGIVTGEMFDVVDIEAPHVDAFRQAVSQHELPDAPLVRSGRGGVHLYVTPLGRGTQRLELDGVHIGEWKGSGGVVAPPSITEAGYAWLRSPLERPLPDAPDWLCGLIVTSRGPSATTQVTTLTPSRAIALAHGLYDVVSRAQEGERNRLLFWASCRAAEHGLDPSAITEILESAAVKAGLSEREARATIASGLGR